MGKTCGGSFVLLGGVPIVHGSEGTELVVEAEFDLRPENRDEKRAVWRFFLQLPQQRGGGLVRIVASPDARSSSPTWAARSST